jgi:hypothetical protein
MMQVFHRKCFILSSFYKYSPLLLTSLTLISPSLPLTSPTGLSTSTSETTVPAPLHLSLALYKDWFLVLFSLPFPLHPLVTFFLNLQYNLIFMPMTRRFMSHFPLWTQLAIFQRYPLLLISSIPGSALVALLLILPKPNSSSLASTNNVPKSSTRQSILMVYLFPKPSHSLPRSRIRLWPFLHPPYFQHLSFFLLPNSPILSNQIIPWRKFCKTSCQCTFLIWIWLLQLPLL